MAHEDGWIEAYGLLEDGEKVPEDLKAKILSNRNGIGETMFHWYAIEGGPHIVQRIINLGFDVNTTNKFHQTPLYECASICRWDMVELLLRNNADPFIKDRNNEDIFEHLESFGKKEQLVMLKELTNQSR